MKLASCKSALNPPVVCSTDRSKAVVPVLVLLFVALWFILRGDLLYVFLAHASLRSRNLGIRQTFLRIIDDFFWPGICADVTRSCKSCKTCHREFHKRNETCDLISTPSKTFTYGVTARRELPY